MPITSSNRRYLKLAHQLYHLHHPFLFPSRFPSSSCLYWQTERPCYISRAFNLRFPTINFYISALPHVFAHFSQNCSISIKNQSSSVQSFDRCGHYQRKRRVSFQSRLRCIFHLCSYSYLLNTCSVKTAWTSRQFFSVLQNYFLCTAWVLTVETRNISSKEQ